MTAKTYVAELNKAGANTHGFFGEIRFLARQYPLGAIGAVILTLFVFAAIFADFITRFDPLTTNAAASLARPFGEQDRKSVV